MGIYDEQIRSRIKADSESFIDSFAKLSGVVMGDAPALDLAASEKSKSAIEEILKFYRLKTREIPGGVTDINDQMDYLLNPAGVMRRAARLTPGWRKKAGGAMLATLKDSGDVVALIPRKMSGYDYFDINSGTRVRVTKSEAEKIGEDVICFYKPLPQTRITPRDFLLYCFFTLSIGDFIMLTALTAIVSAIGLLPPYMTYQMFKSSLHGGDVSIVIPAAAALVGAAVSTTLFGISRQFVDARIASRSGLAVSAAMMARTISLPARFFRNHSSGEISLRLSAAAGICAKLFTTVMTAILTAVFSLIYIGQIFVYAPGLALPAIGVISANLILSTLASLAQMKHSGKIMELKARESGLVFSIIRGVPKLKMSGAERRAFSIWAEAYAKRAKHTFSPPIPARFSSVLTLFVSSLGMVMMYWIAVKNGVNMPGFMAFNTAYGQVGGAFAALAATSLAIANIAQQLNLMKPLFEALPETGVGKKIVKGLSGGFEINNVSFRYSETMPLVLDDITLSIPPGQFVAITGETGCGKSTLVRILLGFETPQKGAVYYDNHDLSTLEPRSLRKHIGVVMQDGKLFQGDVFSNIVISAPQLTMDEAWAAAELAGIADDIRAMPMGMHTIISEGSGGISGGQKQRLMIARAIAPGPKILMFDEATGALDNITRKHVADALAGLKCTRIVIAHRLSTIQQADRIIVMDKGKIAEDGAYDELIAKNGIFADLARRQMVTKND